MDKYFSLPSLGILLLQVLVRDADDIFGIRRGIKKYPYWQYYGTIRCLELRSGRSSLVAAMFSRLDCGF